MTPRRVSKRVVVDRLGMIDSLLRRIRALPLSSLEVFLADPKAVGAAESYLRRSLEALLDIGRHILAKGFGIPVSEYKAIATVLKQEDVILDEEARILYAMAGYRNRLVHFYYEVTDDELYRICAQQLGDIERIADAYRRWLKQHPDRVE